MDWIGKLLIWWVLSVSSWCCAGDGLGVNWGTMATHRLPPKTVVQMLQDNGIKKVKIFDTDPSTMSALAGSGLEVMVAIPNDQLATMTDSDSAKEWVSVNVSRYIFNGGVDIRYVAVGNEPFLTTYNGSFLNVTFPALQNIQNALIDASLGDKIKSTVPLNADVYEGNLPSQGIFRADIRDLMTQIVTFLNQNNCPFTVNIYPFLSLYLDKNFPKDFAFFDGGSTVIDGSITYTNVFDANFDTLVSALNKVNLPNMPIIVGEVGWPTEGDINANSQNAEKFYNGLMRRIAKGQGTPLRPSGFPEAYLFGLLDEDFKSVAPGNFERHWGIFRYDGQPKYPLDLSGNGQGNTLVGAKNVKYLPQKWCMLNPDAKDLSKLGDNINYACTFADCTALGYGSSCNSLDARGNASYAFNMYFQVKYQDEDSCFFQGLATITTQNLSQGSCNFIIQIASSPSFLTPPPLLFLVIVMLMLAV